MVRVDSTVARGESLGRGGGGLTPPARGDASTHLHDTWEGFTLPGQTDVVREWNCVVWLFSSVVGELVVPVVLDTPVKYAFATLGTMGLALVVQLCVRMRSSVPHKIKGRRTQRAADTAVFALHATLAYFLMLISMTYSTPLFVAILLGLSVGHIAFNYDPRDEAAIVPMKQVCC